MRSVRFILTTDLTVAPTEAVRESVHAATLLVEQQEIGKQLLQLDRNHSHLSTDGQKLREQP